MITLENDRLVFRFPEVHGDAACSIEFRRTLRIPDDGKDYPLPPGLSNFPLRHLDDFARRVPDDWLMRGGVILPMHQAEAMWILFGGDVYPSLSRPSLPCAVKIATGKICAVTGETWANHLNGNPQDYIVLPEQPWLDGYCVEKGVIRQFVAMPLGDGYSVEEQITGAAKHGGVQIVVYPMKKERYEALVEEQRFDRFGCASFASGSSEWDMGLAPGGRMQQEIYDDPYGLDAWDQRHSSRCFVTIANSAVWTAVTGELPPTEPPTAKEYTERGLPWFDYYGGDAEAVEGAEKFTKLISVATTGKEKGERPLLENAFAAVERIIALRRKGSKQVREIDLAKTPDPVRRAQGSDGRDSRGVDGVVIRDDRRRGMKDWTALLEEVIPSPCFERPFVCDGLPSASSVIVIGEHPATPLKKNWWFYWEPKTGFSLDTFVAHYKEERGRRGKGISNTRRRLDRIRKQGVKCIETNAYRNEGPDGVGEGISNFALLSILISHNENLKAIIAHGKVAQEFLDHVTLPDGIRTYRPRHFRMESYDEIDRICADIKSLDRHTNGT